MLYVLVLLRWRYCRALEKDIINQGGSRLYQTFAVFDTDPLVAERQRRRNDCLDFFTNTKLLHNCQDVIVGERPCKHPGKQHASVGLTFADSWDHGIPTEFKYKRILPTIEMGWLVRLIPLPDSQMVLVCPQRTFLPWLWVASSACLW
jgi:hypothetical protein